MSRLAIPSLFEESPNSNLNLLPYDGMVNYHGIVFPPSESQQLFQSLLSSIEWEHDEVMMFGKIITTKRKVAWYGDKPFDYTYSQVKKTALPWNDSLVTIKQKIESLSGETYNSCLLNLYHDGNEGMGWHTDDEKELKKRELSHQSALELQENSASNINLAKRKSIYSWEMEACWS